MGVEPGSTDEETIERGIAAMENFFREIHMPTSLAELGVSPTQEQLERMAESCIEAGGGSQGCVVALKKDDIVKIYEAAR